MVGTTDRVLGGRENVQERVRWARKVGLMVILNSGPVVRLDNGTLEMRGERKTAVGEESEWGKGREVDGPTLR